ncbi:hypothetical protein GCM10009767_15550 [Kocuria aegyptia]|uniref:Transposase n=1 Tax=Kocuria aegyptia TaxID=330943 RepID=A0ABP4WPM7_9MICC
MGAVLAEQTDEWAEGRRYLGLEVLTRCRLTTVADAGSEVSSDPLTALTASSPHEGSLHHSRELDRRQKGPAKTKGEVLSTVNATRGPSAQRRLVASN